MDTVQAMTQENVELRQKGLAASGRAPFYSQASKSYRSIFREGNDKLPALLSEAIIIAYCAKEGLGETGV